MIAPLPPGLQEKCLAAPSLIAQVVASKYADHLPLYRQEQIYRRGHGVTIPRQTLCRWTALAAEWMEPVYHEMKRQQMQSAYVQIDETPVRYLEPGKGEAPKGHFWVSSIPGGDAIYHWGPGRGAACLHDFVPAEFTGTLQCDGYKAYSSFQKQRAGPIELAGCWAHARRKFFEAKEQTPKITAWILGQIQQLYRIEKRLRDSRAGPSLRTAVRAAESTPVLARLKRALIKLKPRYLPQNSMSMAIAYALSQWENLERFLQNGAVDIDNNRVENAICPPKLGAKNWLFIGAETSGQTSAILYTIVESAKRHGLDPYAYMRYLLENGAYENFAQQNKVTLLGCMAHARRKFYEALKSHPREAELVLKLIGKLYACEADYRKEGLAPDDRQARRQDEQTRILKWLKETIRICQARSLPQSALGKACAYALGQWTKLVGYLEYGVVELDNNLIENAIRPSALGKKNFLFIGHPDAGQRSAIIYSIVVSCQRHGVNPFNYLRDVLTRLPKMTNQDDIGALAPSKWSLPTT